MSPSTQTNIIFIQTDSNICTSSQMHYLQMTKTEVLAGADNKRGNSTGGGSRGSSPVFEIECHLFLNCGPWRSDHRCC